MSTTHAACKLVSHARCVQRKCQPLVVHMRRVPQPCWYNQQNETKNNQGRSAKTKEQPRSMRQNETKTKQKQNKTKQNHEWCVTQRDARVEGESSVHAFESYMTCALYEVQIKEKSMTAQVNEQSSDACENDDGLSPMQPNYRLTRQQLGRNSSRKREKTTLLRLTSR